MACCWPGRRPPLASQRQLSWSGTEGALESLLRGIAGRVVYTGPGQAAGGAPVTLTVSLARASGAVTQVALPLAPNLLARARRFKLQRGPILHDTRHATTDRGQRFG